jgi:hypothetical protein
MVRSAARVKQMPYEHDSQLAWENLVIVMLTQAMLGLLGPAIRTVGCRFVDGDVQLHFAVTPVGDEVRVDIEEIADALSVFLEGHVDVSAVIHDDRDLDRTDTSMRIVFRAKTISAFQGGVGLPAAHPCPIRCLPFCHSGHVWAGERVHGRICGRGKRPRLIAPTAQCGLEGVEPANEPSSASTRTDGHRAWN